MFLFDPAT